MNVQLQPSDSKILRSKLFPGGNLFLMLSGATSEIYCHISK